VVNDAARAGIRNFRLPFSGVSDAASYARPRVVAKSPFKSPVGLHVFDKRTACTEIDTSCLRESRRL